MIKNVSFNKGGSGKSSGRIILPAPYLELMKVTEEDPSVEITFQDGKIIIEKANKE